MTRPRASTILRRFLDGASIGELAFYCMQESRPHDYVEHCIRRGLRGEVRVPRRNRRRSKP